MWGEKQLKPGHIFAPDLSVRCVHALSGRGGFTEGCTPALTLMPTEDEEDEYWRCLKIQKSDCKSELSDIFKSSSSLELLTVAQRSYIDNININKSNYLSGRRDASTHSLAKN